MPSKKSAQQRSVPLTPQAGDQWEVVIVPFPLSTQPGNKRRPALVLSKRAFNQHGSTVLAMITTARTSSVARRLAAVDRQGRRPEDASHIRTATIPIQCRVNQQAKILKRICLFLAPETYSHLNALIGSTLVARRAGM